jgi:hypothetical protein
MPCIGMHLGNDLHIERAALHTDTALDAHTERGAADALTGNPAYHSLICSIPLAGT